MIDCTCDGTPANLPARHTISGHHESCPVERGAARVFNQRHRAEVVAVHDGDRHIGTVRKWSDPNLPGLPGWIGTYTNLAGLQERYLELTKELAINKLKSVAEAERSQRL
jgi:hypothetical protein